MKPFKPKISGFLLFLLYIAFFCVIQVDGGRVLGLEHALAFLLIMNRFVATFSNYHWKKKFNRSLNKEIKKVINPDFRKAVIEKLSKAAFVNRLLAIFFSCALIVTFLVVSIEFDSLVIKALSLTTAVFIYYIVYKQEQLEDNYSSHFSSVHNPKK